MGNEFFENLTSDSGIPVLFPWRSKCSCDRSNKADSKFLSGWCSCVKFDLSLILNLFACWARRWRIWWSSRVFVFVCFWDDELWWLAKNNQTLEILFMYIFIQKCSWWLSYLAVDDEM